MSTDDEIEAEMMTSGDYLLRIDETICGITDALERLSINDEEKLDHDIPDGEGDDDPKAVKFSTKTAKLPKIVLKSFSGDILRFQEFWECLDSAVHSNEDLNKTAKYNFLRSLLEGEAAATISGLSLTADIYEEAVCILRSRYGNKQVLISAHIDNLLHLTPVVSSKDITKLRGLHSEIEINVRRLKHLDVAGSHYGPIIISIIMSKLPDEIKLIVSRSMASMSTEESDKEWKIGELIRILKQEIESRKCVIS